MNRTAGLTFLAVITAFIAGCGPPSDPSRLNHYADALVSFDYPGNWKITSNEEKPFGRLLILEGKKDSIVTISVYSAEWDAALGEYCDLFASSIAANVPFGKIVDGTWREVASPRSHEEARDYQFTLVIASVRIPCTSNVWRQVHGETKVIGMCQVSDEDRKTMEHGFDLIRGSLSGPTNR